MKANKDKRRDLLYPYIKDKTVLDLGVGDIRDRFLHKFIVDNAKDAMGLELDPKRAKNLQKKGYNVVVANAEKFDIKKKFDVIVAGDLVEHLNNFEGFYQSCKKHLKKDGLLIMNTPNVFGFWVLSGINRKPFEEHSCWFCPDTLRQLSDRFGMVPEKTIYYTNDHGTLKGKLAQLLFRIKPKWNTNFMMVLKRG